MSAAIWASVAELDELPDGKGARVAFGDATVLLVRSGEQVFAIGEPVHAPGSAARSRKGQGGSLARHRDLPRTRQRLRAPGRASAARPERRSRLSDTRPASSRARSRSAPHPDPQNGRLADRGSLRP